MDTLPLAASEGQKTGCNISGLVTRTVAVCGQASALIPDFAGKPITTAFFRMDMVQLRSSTRKHLGQRRAQSVRHTNGPECRHLLYFQAMSNTQEMEGTFSRQEVLSRLTRKRTAAELQLITANRRTADGSSYYAVKKTELELEIKFLQSIIDLIAPGEDISLSPIRDKAIIDLPISVRLYGVLKKNLGNGSHDVSLREIESMPLSDIRQWQNFGKKTEKELIELCELNDIKLRP